uniref:Uncharacterized protein n=1 Tax=Tanacetum cinerariifolium TaxID=118510 RepID=A0A6L2NDS9_TANCI|nr:hypothetical protein [Tanacetum cinerariifolium]
MAVHHTHASHLRLTPSPPTTFTTVIYHPPSLSLALQHPDTSFSLYTNISPLTPPPTTVPTVVTTVSPPSSAAVFLTLKTTATSSSTVFIVTSPFNNSILLRFYMLVNNKFVRVKVRVKQRDMCYDERKVGVLFKVNHGVNVNVVAGASNVFVMYSVTSKKVWVFGVKLCEGGEEVKVVRTAVIDCDLPVFSVGVSVGELVLGEENGVRVFNLRSLVKGRVENGGKMEGKKVNGSAVLYGKYGKVIGGRRLVSLVNGNVEEKIAKLKPVKTRQNSKDGGVRFVAFKCNELEDHNSSKVPSTSIKAISVHFLAHNNLLILDSFGDLYLLSLSNSVSGSDSTCEMKKLTLSMKVQNLAVLPDDSSRPQTVWLSDGQYTIHAMIISDADSPTSENGTKDIKANIQNADRHAHTFLYHDSKHQSCGSCVVGLSAIMMSLIRNMKCEHGVVN